MSDILQQERGPAHELPQLLEADTQVYGKVMAAYRQPQQDARGETGARGGHAGRAQGGRRGAPDHRGALRPGGGSGLARRRRWATLGGERCRSGGADGRGVHARGAAQRVPSIWPASRTRPTCQQTQARIQAITAGKGNQGRVLQSCTRRWAPDLAVPRETQACPRSPVHGGAYDRANPRWPGSWPRR